MCHSVDISVVIFSKKRNLTAVGNARRQQVGRGNVRQIVGYDVHTDSFKPQGLTVGRYLDVALGAFLADCCPPRFSLAVHKILLVIRCWGVGLEATLWWRPATDIERIIFPGDHP